MQARQFLRVGGFLLLFTSSVSAQPIPFDYWYGRILGSPLISLSGGGGKYTIEKADFHASAGNNESFRLRAQDLATVYYYPDLESYIGYPDFSGDLRLSPSVRLRANQIRYSESTWSIDDRPSILRTGHSDQTVIDLNLLYIESGAIEFDADQSLLLLQRNLWPRRTQLLSQTSFFLDDRSEHIHETARWKPEVIEVDHDGRNVKERSLSTVARYGLTDRTSLGAFLEYQKSRADFVTRHQEFDSLWYEDYWESFDSDESDHTSRFALGFCFDHRLNRAIWLNASARRLTIREAETDENPDAPDGFRNVEMQLFGSGNEYSLRATCFVNADSLQYSQILDNYSYYYGEQLSDGAWMFKAELELMKSSLRYEGWLEERQSIIDRNFRDTLSVSATIRYYALANCYFSFNPTYRAISDGNSARPWVHQIQSARSSMTIDFFTYRWTRGDRSAISWSQVSDLDYLLGPLLRRGDGRARLIIEFPEWRGTVYGGRRSLLSGVEGDFRYAWTVDCAAAFGFRNNLEGAIRAVYERIPASGAPTTEYLNEWRHGGRMTYQFHDHFRLNLGIEQHWVQTTRSGRPADYFDYQQFDFQVNLRF